MNLNQPLTNEQLQALFQHHPPTNQTQVLPSSLTWPAGQQLQMGQLSMLQQAQPTSTAAAAFYLGPGSYTPAMSIGHQPFMPTSLQGDGMAVLPFTDEEVGFFMKLIQSSESPPDFNSICRDAAAVTRHTSKEWATFCKEKIISFTPTQTDSTVTAGSSSNHEPSRVHFYEEESNAESSKRKESRRTPRSRISEVIDITSSTEEEDEDLPEFPRNHRAMKTKPSIDEADVSLESSEDEKPTPDMIRSRKAGHKTYYPEEKRVLAKYIAKVGLDNFLKRGHKTQIISEFASEMAVTALADHPRRTENAWLECARKNANEIEAMARRYEIRDALRKKRSRSALRATKLTSLGKLPPKKRSAETGRYMKGKM